MNDDWLDAFDPEELDDPAFARIDAAVERSAPKRRRWWPVLVVPLVLAAAALLWIALPVEPPPIRPPNPAPIAQVDVGSPLAAPRRVEEGVGGPSPDAPTFEEPQLARTPVAPAPETTSVAPPPIAPAPEVAPTVAYAPAPEAGGGAPVPLPVRKRPGLQLRPGSLATVQGDTAVLSSGVLTYRHDATHEPGVRRVTITEPPLVARPIGTAFTASTSGGFAAIQVTEGEVWVERTDGRAVLPLAPGDEVLVFREGDGLAWLATGHLPLDEVVDLLPKRRARDGRAVISLLASLRLAAREGLDEARVPFVLDGEL